MSRFQFIHAADLHLDTPFEGIARIAPRVAAALQEASLEAWEELVELTLREDAAFLLLAGDIYDGSERGVRAQLRLRQGLARLAERGVDTLIVHGNHDPLGGWSAIRDWPEGVTVFGAGRVEAIAIERHGQRLATIHGTSYAQRETTENLALAFDRGDDSGLHIGLLHCNVGSDTDHAAYCPCSIADLRRAGMDYWALGHIHRRQILSAGDPWIVYPGNTQGRSPKPSELGAKGAMVVEVEEGRIVDVRFRPTDRVRFHHLSLDIAEHEDLAALRQDLLDAACALREEHGDRGLLVRVTLTGRGPLQADLRRPRVVSELLDELREEFAEEEPLFWWESCRDQTRAEIDKSALLGRDDFAGELVRAAAELRQQPAELCALAAAQWAALAGMRVPVDLDLATPADELPPAELLDRLMRAEDLALDLLGGEDAP